MIGEEKYNHNNDQKKQTEKFKLLKIPIDTKKNG